LEQGKLATLAIMRKAPPEVGEALPTWTINKQASLRRWVWCHLPQCAWRGEGIQHWLKYGTLNWRMGEEHLPMWTLNSKGLQLQQAGKAIYWRKQKGYASRRTLNEKRLQG
jgi:hypothetical protein